MARIKPHRNHPLYFEWQTATACLFIGESDRIRAQTVADAELKNRGWERMEFVERATLIDARVRAEGGAVLDAYLKAQAGELFYVEELDDIAFSTKNSPGGFAVPRLTETFIDSVVSMAGGTRLDVHQSGPNPPKTADYRIDDLILELKDLQSEGLEVRSRQEKLATLFGPKCRPDGSSIVDAAILSEDGRRDYLEIVGAPIQKRLVAASHQVRATLARLDDAGTRGGAILLNTGYGSISHDELVVIAARYLWQSTTLSVVICISAFTITNGFDTVANFMFHPPDEGEPTVRRFRDAFWRGINRTMGDWARGGFRATSSTAPLLRPIVFEEANAVFTVPAPKAPRSIPRPGEESDAGEQD